MGKCPKCKWKGSSKQYQKHYALHHFKPKKGKGKVKVFKKPGYTKKR